MAEFKKTGLTADIEQADDAIFMCQHCARAEFEGGVIEIAASVDGSIIVNIKGGGRSAQYYVSAKQVAHTAWDHFKAQAEASDGKG